ncbi:MAG: C39 family peptidase [Candidatus Eremiobacteraeota bacterium]|nr:C39 family peptidase [Candidatus Eremiobacteraeota bacterium]
MAIQIQSTTLNVSLPTLMTALPGVAGGDAALNRLLGGSAPSLDLGSTYLNSTLAMQQMETQLLGMILNLFGNRLGLKGPAASGDAAPAGGGEKAKDSGSPSASGPVNAGGKVDAYNLVPRQTHDNDCGVAAARGILRSFGYDADEEELFKDAIAHGAHSGRNGGWNGYGAMVKYLDSFGIKAHSEAFTKENVDKQLAAKKPVMLSTAQHWMVISGKDKDGNYILGNSGSVVNLGKAASFDKLKSFSSAHQLVVIDGEPTHVRPPVKKMS